MGAIGIDLYNQCITGGVSMSLRAVRGDNEHIPCVIVGGGVEHRRKDGTDIRPQGTSKHAYPKRLQAATGGDI